MSYSKGQCPIQSVFTGGQTEVCLLENQPITEVEKQLIPEVNPANAADELTQDEDKSKLINQKLNNLEMKIEEGQLLLLDPEKRKKLIQLQKVDREYVSLFPTDKSATDAVQFLKVANANYLADLNEFETSF